MQQQPQQMQQQPQQMRQKSREVDRTMGVTSLSSILDEKSLFDEYKNDKNDPMKRPRGTDVEIVITAKDLHQKEIQLIVEFKNCLLIV